MPPNMREFQMTTKRSYMNFQVIILKNKQADGPKNICNFWQRMKCKYGQFTDIALTELLPIAATYLCNSSFSYLTDLKKVTINRLCPGNYLTVAVSMIKNLIDYIKRSPNFSLRQNVWCYISWPRDTQSLFMLVFYIRLIVVILSLFIFITF
jgi:hypothetical protein